MTHSPSDTAAIRRAIDLAGRGAGHVEPNPQVGAVVVAADGTFVGEGWHTVFGGPHAEGSTIAAAGPAARGATLCVTLEPGCHHGKTPPCTAAIIAAGIARVVIASGDPFPAVAGRGIAALRAAGIDVMLERLIAEEVQAGLACLDRAPLARPGVVGLTEAARMIAWRSA